MNKIKYRFWLVLLFSCVFGFLLLCCDVNSGSSGGGGTGSPDEGTAGSPISLPDGLSIQEIHGDSSVCMGAFDQETLNDLSTCIAECDEDDLDCHSACYADAGIYPSSFPVSITINNVTTSPADLTIDAGIEFVPADSDSQNLLLPIDEDFSILPGEGDYCLPVYCLNSSLSAPGPSDRYTASTLAVKPCSQEILNLLEDKDRTSFSIENIQDIQRIIWHCADNDTISQEDKDLLSGL